MPVVGVVLVPVAVEPVLVCVLGDVLVSEFVEQVVVSEAGQAVGGGGGVQAGVAAEGVASAASTGAGG